MKKHILGIILILTSSICSAQYLSKKEVLEDLNEFKILLEKQSSYYQLSNFDFESRYKNIEEEIRLQDSIPTYFLAYALEKIIAETIDRHANIRMPDFEEDDFELFNLHFPFAVAPLNGKVVALKRNEKTKEYDYYSDKHHFIKSINGEPIDEFLDHYAYRRRYSPEEAKLKDGLKDLRDIGELYFKQNELEKREVQIVLTNGKKDESITFPLSDKKHKWSAPGSITRADYSMLMREKFDYNQLNKWLDDSIAYMRFPSMVSYRDYKDLEAHINTSMKGYLNANALIIDIRGNGGGTREILNTLSSYIVQPEQSPWVANVAYVRSDQQLDEDIASMQGRFLYNYYSDSLSDNDRKAIDNFNSGYKTEYKVDSTKFSSPYYMILHNNTSPLTCPIYILINEECFSAASVFTSAFKGLPNVKIVGVNTNGSSGRSVKFYLKNSNIRVKLSTMLSFQRNGKTLDGNGTVPDILIERSENQVLGKNDTQLEKLIELIKNDVC